MNTAALFVEILIAGLESLVWIWLLISIAFSPQWSSVFIKTFSDVEVFITTVSLGFVYAIGVIIEELTDAIFEPWSNHLKKSFIDSDMPSFYDMQLYVSSHGGRDDEQFDYMRSRRRILRVSAFNIFLIGILALLLLWIQFPYISVSSKIEFSMVILFLGLGGSALSLFAYKRTTKAFVKTIQRMYKILKDDK